ncbi:ca2+:h+ antiporter [Fusarium longipes]|uniref:Vacuolar calcium ion transporter n=1 Tax=Fusarium longipes TaxID=694270 RepID=A0A395SEU9_9HYPO|nr:ca2+:h+ antiporter [Fusarium longipes]
MSNKSTNHSAADETSPLINGGASSSLHDTLGRRNGNANGNGHISLSRDSSTMTFLFDSKHTPGIHNENIAVRSLAYSWHIAKVTLLSNYVNFLLVMVPLGIIAGKMGWNSTAVFTINFFAIIPLAAVLSFATEEFSLKLGDTLGGLLNATFGNAVELIVSIVALQRNEIELVQASMLGSILSNLLLVMGMCFLFGGIIHRGESGRGTEQVFSSATAQTTCSLMTLSSASLVIPAALYAVLDQSGSKEKAQSILILSRGTAIILLLLYVLYLVFQLRTHSNLFDAENQTDDDEDAEHEHEEPTIGPVAAIAVLIVTTLLVTVCADYLVDSIDDLVTTSGISRAFIGLILIPIVGNAAEHVTAVVVAVRDKMDLAMGVAIGSSIQIALLVTPFLVIVGWIIGSEMTLHFETFQTVAFAVSVLVVTYTVQDGKSNYLEGAMLMGLYIIIALAFYATPSDVMDPGN